MTFQEWRAEYYQVILTEPLIVIDDWHDDDARDVWISYVVLPYDPVIEAYHREVAAMENGYDNRGNGVQSVCDDEMDAAINRG